MNAAEVCTAVRRKYGCEEDGIGPEWAALDEMDLQPGYSTRRIDLLLVRAWRGGRKGHERHAVEVKVSRSDLRRELDTRKWEAWAAVTHRFYLAVPDRSIIDGFTFPEQWGIYLVNGAGVRTHKAAQYQRTPQDLPPGVFVEAFRRASRAEARIRSADHDDAAARIAALEREVASCEAKAHRAREAEARWRNRSDSAMRLLACANPPLQCRCGTPLKPKRRGSDKWDHDGEPGMREGWGTVAPRPCDWPSPDTDALAESVLEV